MRFYHIREGYIDFLRNFDDKVSLNKHETRPYVGIVFQIGKHKYYAPFTSPKEKHKTMSNGIDFRKIDGGRYGAINFNNMIPVVDKALIEIDFKAIQDERYKRLLIKQYRAILSDFENITKTAERLYSIIFSDYEALSNDNKKVVDRCCNLRLLESIYDKWIDKLISPTYNKPYNEETMKAINELWAMEKYPERYKRYDSVEEMFKDIDCKQ